VGWNIWNVLLDFTGGSLSVAQELIDCASRGDWNGIAGNPVKFCLGSLSMVYDVIFMLQHFVWYRANNERLHKQGTTDATDEG
jgi:cystinosin